MAAHVPGTDSRSSLVVRAILLGLALPLGTRTVQAQHSVSQTVQLRVVAASQAAVQSAVAALPVRSTGPTIAMGTYGIATSETNQKISASLDRAMPAGTSLSVSMAVPSGAAAVETTLGTAATDVVTGIPVSAASGLPVSYMIQGQVPRAKAERRVITYTFTAGI